VTAPADRALDQREPDPARDARLIARAAAAGVTLRRIDPDRWVASRWGLVAVLDDSSVEAWLDRVTGVRP
jgi:hypothetical protein